MISKRKEELGDVVHKRLLALRNLQTVIQLRDFQSLYNNSSVEEQKRVNEFVDKFDYMALREWVKQQRLSQLGILGVRDLRKIASELGVSDYNHLPKSLLLSAIASKKNGSTTGVMSFNPGIAQGNEAINGSGENQPGKI